MITKLKKSYFGYNYQWGSLLIADFRWEDVSALAKLARETVWFWLLPTDEIPFEVSFLLLVLTPP